MLCPWLLSCTLCITVAIIFAHVGTTQASSCLNPVCVVNTLKGKGANLMLGSVDLLLRQARTWVFFRMYWKAIEVSSLSTLQKLKTYIPPPRFHWHWPNQLQLPHWWQCERGLEHSSNLWTRPTVGALKLFWGQVHNPMFVLKVSLASVNLELSVYNHAAACNIIFLCVLLVSRISLY